MEVAKTTFELLVECLGKNKEIHLHIIWGTMALQIAAIGWFLSSGSARAFIGTHKGVKVAGMLAVSVIAIIHFCLLHGTYRESEVFTVRITGNEYYKTIPGDSSVITDFWRINKYRAAMRGVFTLTLFGALNYLVYTCSP